MDWLNDHHFESPEDMDESEVIDAEDETFVLPVFVARLP